MLFTKISRKSAVALSALSLLFVVSCGKDNSANNDIYAETVADVTWEDEDETSFYFKINFIAEEGEGIYGEGEDWGGEPFKNRPIEMHTVDHVNQIKKRKGYKPRMKPLKHQKIRIKYEKKYPYMIGFLEHFKYQDEQGNVVELD